MGKYNLSLDKIYFYDRWTYKYPPDDWCVIGMSVKWYDSRAFEYRICLFGFELRVRIKRTFKT